MMLSERERAVVDAMRMGGRVKVTFENSSYENAMANADAAPILMRSDFTDLTHSKIPFVIFELSDRKSNVEISHYLQIGGNQDID